MYETKSKGSSFENSLLPGHGSKPHCYHCIADNGPCLGYREGPGKPYQWLHYNEALLRAKNFGAGLVSLGLPPGPETFVGIYSQNCPEWILTEQGLYCQSMVIVPLYDTLGPEACNFIINQGKESFIMCCIVYRLVFIIYFVLINVI